MTKCRFLTGLKLSEIDNILSEQILIFKRQADVMQSGIIGANSNIDPGIETAIEHQF